MTTSLNTYWDITEAEIDLLTPKPQVSISQWAETEFSLPQQKGMIGGPFSFEYSPYLREIADALGDYFTREVWVQAPTQAAKSTLAHIKLGYNLTEDPANLMIAMPDEKTLRRRLQGRIRRLFEANPKMLAAIGGKIENLNVGEATILERMDLYLAWAHSPAAMSDVSVPDIIADEVAKFPPRASRDVDPINLLRSRQKTFPSISKLLAVSSPALEGDLFDGEYNQGLIHAYWLLCPLCDRYFVSTNDDMILERDKKTREFLPPAAYEEDMDGKLAWFRCPLCEKRWRDNERAYATIHGRWAPEGCTVNRKGEIEGPVRNAARKSYGITTFMVHPAFAPISRIAAAWARTVAAQKAGNLLPLEDYRNNIQGVPWRLKHRVTKSEALTKRIEHWAIGHVPDRVQFLTAGIDVQLDHIWIAVWGWGYMAECWLIYAGRLETPNTEHLERAENVFEFLETQWPPVRPGGQSHRIYLTGIDIAYHVEGALDFCRACWRRQINILPVMGSDKVKFRSYKQIEDRERRITRYDLNTDNLKDRRFRLLFESEQQGEPPFPGYAHLPEDVPQVLLDHLTSEDREHVPKGQRMISTWRPKSQNRPNHLNDCTYYAIAVADISGLWQLPPEPPKGVPEIVASESNEQSQAEGFLDDLPNLE